MTPVTITLVIQGHLKYEVDWEYIWKWHSKFFNIVGIERVECLPNYYVIPSGYSDRELAEIFSRSNGSDAGWW